MDAILKNLSDPEGRIDHDSRHQERLSVIQFKSPAAANSLLKKPPPIDQKQSRKRQYHRH